MDLPRVGQGDRRGASGHVQPTAQPAKAHAQEKVGLEEEKPLEGAPLGTVIKGVAVDETSHRTKDECRLDLIRRRVARRA